ncbi:S8 family peptidase [Croceibacterium ferulae]|uniref:S8 family peptidase n=1 Tax=Croceibacterium ferulae TaxID=1854641 RepID=UPI000EAC06D4|nr:S8 family peptidase [Croceibacterium ferulae]
MHLHSTKRRLLAAAAITLPVMPLAGSPAAAQMLTPAAATAQPVEADRAVPMTGFIRAFGGEVDPQTGFIRAFGGGIDPKTGFIRAFGGSLQPFTGFIRAFEGEVSPHTGFIRAFGGDIDPYTGFIRAFWGNLTPEGGELSPQTGFIRAFGEGYIPRIDDTLHLWMQGDASGDYGPLAAQLQSIADDGAAIWGDAVRQRTGKDFAEGFANRFYADWGIDPADPASLGRLSVVDRQLMMLDWHDEMLGFSGMDNTDHWMNAVNWRPALTQVQGGGRNTTIGLVDFFAAADSDVASKVVFDGGYADVDNPHGTAVGSLMVASHDGRGVMGIAPEARIAAYNPFDASMTAGWDDVRAGIAAVARAGASVVNLSLGVSGQTLPTDWRGVFRASAVDSHKDRLIYVIAAGNDGIAQTANIEMNGALDSTFLVVGSVDPGGTISSFSNTPGTACITDGGDCKNRAAWNAKGSFEKTDYLKESGLLMNRFLVAPGELILVADGTGGVTRMSGTSFAAPLVSGAIALLHDRWPWLRNHPRDTAKIILESAQDLGAPGVDAVYGHGLLDIEASQAPLDFGKLKYYRVMNGSVSEVSAKTLGRGGVPAGWSAQDAYFTAFEKIDSAERDFLIPLSDRLFNASLGGRSFQDFVYHRMIGWIGGGGSNRHIAALTDLVPGTAMPLADGWSMVMRGRTEQVAGAGHMDRTMLRASVEVTAPDNAFSVGFGHGDGAVLLGGTGGLQMTGDFNPQTGGANPLLGFASGGAHVATTLRVAPKLELQMGVTRQDRPIEQDMAGAFFNPADAPLLQTLDDYRAVATQAKVTWRPDGAVSLSAAFTRLQEAGAFLGVRSLDRGDFGAGTASNGVTIAGDATVGSGLSLFASGTLATSASRGAAALQVGDTVSSAFQLGVAKQAVLGGADRLRLSLAQPLTMERGTMRYSERAVIDRETGEIGIVTREVGIGVPGGRRMLAEAIYGTDMADGRGSASLFTSAELREHDPDMPAWTVGGNVRWGF